MTSTSVCAHASFGVFAIVASSGRVGRVAADSVESDASAELPCSEERMRVLYKTVTRSLTPPHFTAATRGG